MGVRALPRIAGLRPRDAPPTSRWPSSSAGRCRASDRGRRARGHRRARRRGDPGARGHRRRAGRGAGRGAGLARAGPLDGRRACPRARAGHRLAARLRDLGATVVEAPAIRTVPLAMPDLGGYDRLVATSPNGARVLFARLLDPAATRAGSPASRRGVGPGTARTLRRARDRARHRPGAIGGGGLAEALADVPVERALARSAREGRDVVFDALRARGAQVDVLALYGTLPEARRRRGAALRRRLRDVRLGLGARHLLGARARGARAARRLASIGPPRRRAARARPQARPRSRPDTPDGLVRRCSPPWDLRRGGPIRSSPTTAWGTSSSASSTRDRADAANRGSSTSSRRPRPPCWPAH